MATTEANILLAVKCAHSVSFVRVFANPGEKPLDTYRRVCEAHEPGDPLPDYVGASGYAA